MLTRTTRSLDCNSPVGTEDRPLGLSRVARWNQKHYIKLESSEGYSLSKIRKNTSQQKKTTGNLSYSAQVLGRTLWGICNHSFPLAQVCDSDLDYRFILLYPNSQHHICFRVQEFLRFCKCNMVHTPQYVLYITPQYMHNITDDHISIVQHINLQHTAFRLFFYQMIYKKQFWSSELFGFSNEGLGPVIYGKLQQQKST